MTKAIGLLVVTLLAAGIVASSGSAQTMSPRTCTKKLILNTYVTFQGRDALWVCKKMAGVGTRYYGKPKGTVLCAFMSFPPKIFSVIVRAPERTDFGDDICAAWERNRQVFKIG